MVLAACSSGGDLPEFPVYPPTARFIEDHGRVQERIKVLEEYRDRVRAQALNERRLTNWETWQRVNRSHELGLQEQADLMAVRQLFRVTNEEFKLQEWNIHRNRRRQGESLQAYRVEQRAQNQRRNLQRAAIIQAGIQARLDQVRLRQQEKAAREAQETRRLQGLAVAASQRAFEINRQVLSVQRPKNGPLAPRNQHGQLLVVPSANYAEVHRELLARNEAGRMRREERNALRSGQSQEATQKSRENFQRLQQDIAAKRQRVVVADRQRALAAFNATQQARTTFTATQQPAP